MNCERYQEIEEKNLYKKLTQEENNELFEHISVCNECRASYELYCVCQEKFEEIEIPTKENNNIKDKVHAIVEKLADHSLFDFIFGFGHSPVKAGIIVGIVLLILSIFIINIFSGHKQVKYETFKSSNINSNYATQFKK